MDLVLERVALIAGGIVMVIIALRGAAWLGKAEFRSVWVPIFSVVGVVIALLFSGALFVAAMAP